MDAPMNQAVSVFRREVSGFGLGIEAAKIATPDHPLYSAAAGPY